MTACVYTILTGGYEQLNPQPAAADSQLRFICLTDDPSQPAAAGWEIRPVRLPLPGDTVRSQRMMKILAHKYLPEFSASLYIDNTVRLLQPPEALFDATAGAPLALCQHSFRTQLHEEFHSVVEQRLDDGARVAEQRAHYEAATPALLSGPVLWTGLLLRRHDEPRVREIMDLWCAHVLRYSRRDQLSVTMALHLAAYTPLLLPWDNYLSPYHSWPHATARQTGMRCFGAPESAAAQIAELEARLVSMWQGRLAAEAALAALQAEQAARAAAAARRPLARARALLSRAAARRPPAGSQGSSE